MYVSLCMYLADQPKFQLWSTHNLLPFAQSSEQLHYVVSNLQ